MGPAPAIPEHYTLGVLMTTQTCAWTFFFDGAPPQGLCQPATWDSSPPARWLHSRGSGFFLSKTHSARVSGH